MEHIGSLVATNTSSLETCSIDPVGDALWAFCDLLWEVVQGFWINASYWEWLFIFSLFWLWIASWILTLDLSLWTTISIMEIVRPELIELRSVVAKIYKVWNWPFYLAKFVWRTKFSGDVTWVPPTPGTSKEVILHDPAVVPTCPVCRESYENSKWQVYIFLQCGHTLCETCEQTCNAQRCPICNKTGTRKKLFLLQ